MSIRFCDTVRCKACNERTVIADLVVVEPLMGDHKTGPFDGHCSCDSARNRALVSFSGQHLHLHEEFAELISANEGACCQAIS